jgi:hypothetical protein
VAPVTPWAPSEIELCELLSVWWTGPPVLPYATALTGMSKSTRTSEPVGTVIQRSVTRATGARSVSCSLRTFPNAQPSHPGLRTFTSTDTSSPGVSRFSGVSRPPSSASGTRLPSDPNACTRSIVPPSGCTVTRASAVESPASVTPDHTSAATASSTTITTIVPATPSRARLRPRPVDTGSG